MFSKAKIGVRLWAGFAVILVLTLALGVIAQTEMTSLANLTNKFHKHPYTVTSAVLRADRNIIAMEREMKAVALAPDNTAMTPHIEAVDSLEAKVLEEFEILEERFLGDKALVTSARQAVLDWRPIREEVLDLMKDGRIMAAADVADDKGAAQIALIDERMQALIDFAQNKGGSFITNANTTRDEAQALVWALIAATAILVGVIAYATTRSITRPLNDLRGAMVRLADNDLDVAIPGTERADEIGQMAGTAQIFKDNAIERRRLEEEQQSVERQRTLRVRAALDSSNAAMMIVDPDHKIVYVNRSAEQMFRRTQGDLRAALPDFDAEKLLDTDAKQRFHQAGGGDNRVLDTLTATRAAHHQIALGNSAFDLKAAPIIDEEGQRLGTAIEWRDVTQEVAVESEIKAMVSAIANGDFSQQIALDNKTGFMRQLSESMNHINDTVKAVMADMGGALSALAKGDLTHRITKDYQGTFETIKNDANQTVERLGAVVGDISRAANDISNAAAEISAGSQDLSNRTEQQASSLEETAGSMEEMATTVRQNAGNAQQANELADNARNIAETGAGVVEGAVSSMGKIEESSEKVADIIGVIDEIAFQTNLLALNAAVEAARAGEAGKGFAVVAKEVRTLAQRSSEAARDIKALIKDSNDQIKAGVSHVNEAGSTFHEITSSVKQVASYVADIASASKQQASGVEEIKISVSQMDEMTQKNSALVEESSASARSLQDEAEGLTRMVSYFTIENDGQPQGQGREQGQGQRPSPGQAQRPREQGRGWTGNGSNRGGNNRPANRGAPASRQSAAPAIDVTSDDGWEEF